MTKKSEAYLHLENIAKRSKANAKGIPQRSDIKAFWSGIGFQLDGRHYVSPIPEIAEILPTPRYTQVPGVKTWVRGVANVRGRLLPIMDLRTFFFERITHQKVKRNRVLIVDHGDVYSGIVVDEVLGMQHFEKSLFSSDVDNNDAIDATIAPYLNGYYSRDGEVWPVFSPMKLAIDPKFLKAAS